MYALGSGPCSRSSGGALMLMLDRAQTQILLQNNILKNVMHQMIDEGQCIFSMDNDL